jgi:hypothetical protein
MPSLSIRSQILAAIATDCAGLTEAAGYSFTQRTVVRDIVNVVATKLPLPLVMVYSGDEEHKYVGPGSRAASGQVSHEFELHVTVVTEAVSNLEQVGLEMLADVQQLLTAFNRDVSLSGGGTAIIGIVPVRTRVLVGDVEAKRAGGDVQFIVTYKTLIGQPRVAA